VLASRAQPRYGHAGRAFLEKLTRDKRDWQAHYDAFKEFIVGGADGQVKRAASKFGLVADDRRVG
jgi:putative DNA primase/helicase